MKGILYLLQIKGPLIATVPSSSPTAWFSFRSIRPTWAGARTCSYAFKLINQLSYCRSLDCDGAVKFAHGLVLVPEHSANLGWGSDLLNCSIEFISKLKEISIDHVEFCILSAIVLTYPGIYWFAVSKLNIRCLYKPQLYNTWLSTCLIHDLGQ